MRVTRCLSLTVLFLLFTTALSAGTITMGIWNVFSWYALGPINEGQYTFDATPYPDGLRLRVVDCCIIGDQFRLSFDSGAVVFDTSDPSAWDGVDSLTPGADAAWADGRLSHIELFLTGGPWTLDVSVIRLAAGTSSGGAYIRLDDASVPEPATFGILGSALAGLALLRRRMAR